MNHTQIACFLAAARAESFSAAAEAMYMTPSTFGRQISSLEQELGFSLFQRGWKNSELTPAGTIMFEGFSKMATEYNLLVSRALRADADLTGTITIGMLEGQLIDPALRDALGAFQNKYPGVTIDLRRYSFHAMMEALEDGKLDAGITLSVELLSHPELNTMALYSVENEVVLSGNNPLAAGSGLTLSDFSQETFVEIEESDSPIISGLMLDSCKRSGFIPKIHTVKDLRSQILAVELGRGVAAFNKFHQTYHHPGLCHIPVPELPNVEFSLAWRKTSGNHALPCLISVFQDIFQTSV